MNDAVHLTSIAGAYTLTNQRNYSGRNSQCGGLNEKRNLTRQTHSRRRLKSKPAHHD
jgi:hypothetical protein